MRDIIRCFLPLRASVRKRDVSTTWITAAVQGRLDRSCWKGFPELCQLVVAFVLRLNVIPTCDESSVSTVLRKGVRNNYEVFK